MLPIDAQGHGEVFGSSLASRRSLSVEFWPNYSSVWLVRNRQSEILPAYVAIPQSGKGTNGKLPYIYIYICISEVGEVGSPPQTGKSFRERARRSCVCPRDDVVSLIAGR